MSIGFFIIIIVVVSLVVGPMLMLRPNPAQERKEKLRLLARQKGVSFSMRNLPQQAADDEAPPPMAVYFFPPAKQDRANDWLLLRTSYQHDIHFLGWWAWTAGNKASDAEQTVLEKYLPQLPVSVHAVSAGSQGVCVYWDERGDEVALENIIGLLEELRALQPR